MKPNQNRATGNTLHAHTHKNRIKRRAWDELRVILEGFCSDIRDLHEEREAGVGKSHRQNSKYRGPAAGMSLAESHRKAGGWSTGEERAGWRVKPGCGLWSERLAAIFAARPLPAFWV